MHRFKVFILPALLLLIPGAMSAQTNQTEAQRWLAKATLIGQPICWQETGCQLMCLCGTGPFTPLTSTEYYTSIL